MNQNDFWFKLFLVLTGTFLALTVCRLLPVAKVLDFDRIRIQLMACDLVVNALGSVGIFRAHSISSMISSATGLDLVIT